jgi:hypothetical protein
MDARIERASDRRKPLARVCSCQHEPTRLRYGRYRVPSPAACDVEHARYHGDDVDDLDEIQVEDELGALVRRLAVLSPESHPVYHEWLLFRRHRLLEHRRQLDGPPPEPPDKVRVVVVEVE